MSIATVGCNFHCDFCQNSDISQGKVPTRHVPPKTLAELASRDGSIGVAYTYTEPFIWFEYIRDTGRIVHEKGLANVLVTNGYVNEEPLRELLPVIDAMNVDVKSMNPDFYTKVCGGKLEDVLRTVEIANESCLVEVTNLIIPGQNDSDDEIRKLCEWVKDNLGAGTPLHFSRFYPQYKLDHLPPTPVSRIESARNIALDVGLQYVYCGNVTGHSGENTYCPGCKKIVVGRIGYTITEWNLDKDNKCKFCGTPINIIGSYKS